MIDHHRLIAATMRELDPATVRPHYLVVRYYDATIDDWRFLHGDDVAAMMRGDRRFKHILNADISIDSTELIQDWLIAFDHIRGSWAGQIKNG